MTTYATQKHDQERSDIIVEPGWRRRRREALTVADSEQTGAQSNPGLTINLDDGDDDAPSAATSAASSNFGRLGRLRSLRLRAMHHVAEPLVLVSIAAVALVAFGLSGGRGSAVPDAGTGVSAQVPTTAESRSPSPRMIAPASARQGERVSIVAFHSRGVCGAVVLRFDGNPVAQQLTSLVFLPDPAWIGLFMTLDVPATAAAGTHEIELYVPLDGGRRPVCGNELQQVTRLASTTLNVQL
jgi:hypothetical protein